MGKEEIVCLGMKNFEHKTKRHPLISTLCAYVFANVKRGDGCGRFGRDAAGADVVVAVVVADGGADEVGAWREGRKRESMRSVHPVEPPRNARELQLPQPQRKPAAHDAPVSQVDPGQAAAADGPQTGARCDCSARPARAADLLPPQLSRGQTPDSPCRPVC